MGRVAFRAGLGLLVLLAVMQLVPYGWKHSNPPVVRDAPWPDAAARRLAVAACYDCHSHETKWPAYSYVAPMSWLVRRDVEAGRDAFNFSTWDGDGDDAAEEIENGDMPPRRYTLAHPDASLSAAEKRRLIDALNAMDHADGRGDGGRG